MIATTIMISTRVKPPRRLLILFNMLLLSLSFVCLTAIRDIIADVASYKAVLMPITTVFTVNAEPKMSPFCNRRRALLGIYLFAAVVLLRVIVLTRLTNSPFLLPAHGDMHFYNHWALRILRGEWTDELAFYGLPLYPYLLAGIYKIFGYSPFMPGLLQAGLDGGTAVIICQLAIRIFEPEQPINRPDLPGQICVIGPK